MELYQPGMTLPVRYTMELQGDQSDYSIAPADIYSRLAASEKVLSVFGPFYATNHRVLRLDPPNRLSQGHVLEIPYSQLVSVEMVRRANHAVLALGTAMIILGLFIMPVLPRILDCARRMRAYWLGSCFYTSSVCV